MDLSEAGIVEHSYKTEISPHALKMLNAYVTYVEIELCNPQAADAILLDAQRTREKLSAVAGSLRLLRKQVLKDKGYRKISFQTHNYLMIYKIVGNVVYIEAIYHKLQDYENLFALDIESKQSE